MEALITGLASKVTNDLRGSYHRAMRMISLHSACQYASVDVHIGLLWSHLTMSSRDHRTNIDLDPSGSTNMSFNVSEREKRDSVRIIHSSLFVQNLFRKNCMAI